MTKLQISVLFKVPLESAFALEGLVTVQLR